MKVYVDPIWVPSSSRFGYEYYAGGFYEEGELREPQLQLDNQKLYLLIEALDKNGDLRPRLDDKIRQEDLKLMNRLMDLLDKTIESYGYMKGE